MLEELLWAYFRWSILFKGTKTWLNTAMSTLLIKFPLFSSKTIRHHSSMNRQPPTWLVEKVTFQFSQIHE